MSYFGSTYFLSEDEAEAATGATGLPLDDAIYARLVGNAGLFALVGLRVYPVLLPPGMALWPAVSFQLAAGAPLHDLAGPIGLEDTRVQVDSWSAMREGVDAFAESRRTAFAVRRALDGVRGTIVGSGSPVESLTIAACRLDDEHDGQDEAGRLHRVTQTFVISYEG